jgi:hypothetical protein
MRRSSQQPTPSTEGLMPYVSIAGFAAIYWLTTFLLWRVNFTPDIMRDNKPPDFIWTLLAFLLPLMGYGALMQATPASENRFSLTTYVWMQVFGLVVWSLSVWLWAQAYIENNFVSDYTFALVFVFQLLPYWFWVRSMVAPRAPATPAPAPAPGAVRRPSSVADGEGWLKWMGKGEPQRGALILIAALFWTMLYWNIPRVQDLPLSVSIPVWGLLTILMLSIIRMMSKSGGPSGEVSAAADPKSKTPGK